MVRPWCRLQRPSPSTTPVTATTSSISWSTAEHRITTLTTSSSLSSTVASWTRHASLHLARSSPPSHSLACRQKKGIREPSVQAVLLGNGHRSGVCDHQHGSAKWRVRTRWPDPLQYGSLPSRRQWTPAEVDRDTMHASSAYKNPQIARRTHSSAISVLTFDDCSCRWIKSASMPASLLNLSSATRNIAPKKTSNSSGKVRIPGGVFVPSRTILSIGRHHSARLLSSHRGIGGLPL